MFEFYFVKSYERERQIIKRWKCNVIFFGQVDADSAKTQFPFLNLPPDFVAFHQPDHSGHLNPRKLVEAQKILAGKFGAKIVDGSVVDVVVVDVKTETCDELKKGFKKGNSQFLFLYVVFSTADSKYVPEFFC